MSMEKKSRRKIPKQIKDSVRHRQGGSCAVCLLPGRHFHHILAYSLQKEHRANNIMMLCLKHHKLLHLADPETCMQVYEYGYYINTGKLPDDPYSLVTAQEVVDMIKDCY